MIDHSYAIFIMGLKYQQSITGIAIGVALQIAYWTAVGRVFPPKSWMTVLQAIGVRLVGGVGYWISLGGAYACTAFLGNGMLGLAVRAALSLAAAGLFETLIILFFGKKTQNQNSWLTFLAQWALGWLVLSICAALWVGLEWRLGEAFQTIWIIAHAAAICNLSFAWRSGRKQFSNSLLGWVAVLSVPWVQVFAAILGLGNNQSAYFIFTVLVWLGGITIWSIFLKRAKFRWYGLALVTYILVMGLLEFLISVAATFRMRF